MSGFLLISNERGEGRWGGHGVTPSGPAEVNRGQGTCPLSREGAKGDDRQTDRQTDGSYIRVRCLFACDVSGDVSSPAAGGGRVDHALRRHVQ